MYRKVFRTLAFAVLAFIAFWTLSPVTLRPGTGEPSWERFAAFALFGLPLGLGFPKAIGRGAIFAAVVIVSLEALQDLVPGRHGRMEDALVKLAGALAGLGLAAAIDFARRLISR